MNYCYTEFSPADDGQNAGHADSEGVITGEDFLVLGEEWQFYPSTTEHLLRRLVRQNRFLWVHPMGCRRPEWNVYTLKRAFGKALRWAFPRPAPSGSGGFVSYSPPVLPLYPGPAVRRYNRHVMTRGIRSRVASLQMRRPVLLTTSPMAGEIIDDINAKLVVYYVLDNYAEMPNCYSDYIHELEEKILERADVVLVTSAALSEKMSRPGRPAVLLPQGVDYDRFAGLDGRTRAEPTDLAGIPRPRVVFMGLLAPWVDTSIISEVASAYPAASVVCIGATRTDCAELRRLPNVFLIGQRQYERLPQYLAHCDVGLIPFRQTALTEYVNPLKLLEYMAAGLPVVSTPMRHVNAFSDIVYCAWTGEAFVELVGTALREFSEDKRSRSMDIARRNSWDERARSFSGVVRQALRNKSVGELWSDAVGLV